MRISSDFFSLGWVQDKQDLAEGGTRVVNPNLTPAKEKEEENIIWTRGEFRFAFRDCRGVGVGLVVCICDYVETTGQQHYKPRNTADSNTLFCWIGSSVI